VIRIREPIRLPSPTQRHRGGVAAGVNARAGAAGGLTPASTASDSRGRGETRAARVSLVAELSSGFGFGRAIGSRRSTESRTQRSPPFHSQSRTLWSGCTMDGVGFRCCKSPPRPPTAVMGQGAVAECLGSVGIRVIDGVGSFESISRPRSSAGVRVSRGARCRGGQAAWASRVL
jgi:hypothetical protein